MASEVLSHQAIPFSKDNSFTEASPDEIQDFQKVIKLRNDVLAGNHPRFKPPPSWQLPAQPDAARRPPELANSVGSIDGVLLAKPDVLIKAEMSMKRQRVEKELKQQVEQRKIDTRLGIEVRDGKVIGEEDIDLDDALKKADVWIGPIERPEDPSSVERLHPFYGEDAQEEDKKQDLSESRPGQYVPPPPLPEYRPPPQSTIAPLPTRGAEGSTAQSRDGGYHQAGAAPPREGKPPASDSLRQLALDDTLQQLERANSPQPRFSATSHVRTPIAPQPLRQANMARVESQDHLIEVENSSVGGFSDRRRSPPPPSRDRGSPRTIIKSESSPYLRDGLARRPLSPARGFPHPGSPVQAYYGRPPDTYDQRPPPPRDYHYAAPPPPPVPPVARHPYDYPYRDPPPFQPYQPPPVEYRRPYPTHYPPMPPAQGYYPPRPAYDDYAAERYGSRPPPPLRRSASPPVARGRPRRESRSISPQNDHRRRSPTAAGADRERDRHERALTRPPIGTAAPTPAPRDDRQNAPPPQRAGEPYPPDYPAPYVPPPRDRLPYYEHRDLRDPYYLPPPPPRYMDDPMGRAESGVLPRDDYRGYRERDYPPPTHRPPPSGPPPPPMYPPDYRAASRAAMHPAYPPPPPRPVDYYAGEFADRHARQQSVRPEGPGPDYYGEVGYHRAPSVRPTSERERYDMGSPPLPPPPPPPNAGYRY